MLRICIAGATGWVGQALVPAIEAAPDLALVGAVARSGAGRPLSQLVPGYGGHVRLSGSVAEALDAHPSEVLVEYTAPEAARAHALEAIRRGVHVVVGTSGLDEDDFHELDAAARDHGVGVLAAGNFAITAVLLQRFAVEAARHLPTWEILDYSAGGKPDAPSGTARELARRISEVGRPALEVPVEETQGYPQARGLSLHGTQVHSVRVPGFVIGVEAIFGRDNERLSLRYDGGSGAEPYVAGTLMAARRVDGFVGLKRGLDVVMDAG